MNTKRLVKISSLTLFLIALLASSTAHAQLTTALSLKPIFSNNANNVPNLLFKYELAQGKYALRLRAGGNLSKTENIQNFYEDDMYYNLDKWPEDVSMDGGNYKANSYMINPGFEIRMPLSEQTTFYYGLDIAYSKFNYTNNSQWHYATKDINSGLYTIQQVRKNSYDNLTQQISPTPLIGIQQNVKGGLKVLIEASINAGWLRNTGENSNDIYYWDAGIEEFYQPNQNTDPFKEQAIPWNFNSNLNPQIDLMIAYTFGSK